MAEQRQKTHSVLLRMQGKIISLELFAAHLWPDQPYADGLYRVRINDAWHCPTGKYSFLTLAAVGELMAVLLGGASAPQPESAPFLPCKADVRVHLDELVPLRGSVHAPPHQEQDGRWWVWVWIFGRGPVKAPCTDVTLIRVR